VTVFWIVAIVVLIIIEAVTVGLVTVWFAIGGAAALVLALLDLPVWLQGVAFVLVSAVVLAFARPYAMKFVNTNKKPTNADRVIGMIGVVSEDIDNIAGHGAVSVDGKEWTARTAGGEKLTKGTYVRPVSIQGVKLIVEEVKHANVYN
jgi:membrane protein implicated in regulation of membrane protease activity